MSLDVRDRFHWEVMEEYLSLVSDEVLLASLAEIVKWRQHEPPEIPEILTLLERLHLRFSNELRGRVREKSFKPR